MDIHYCIFINLLREATFHIPRNHNIKPNNKKVMQDTEGLVLNLKQSGKLKGKKKEVWAWHEDFIRSHDLAPEGLIPKPGVS